MSNKEYKNLNMVCLYIFTHNKTGLKYFGKTTNAFDTKSLLTYGGSGTYWNDHKRVHGKDLSVEIYGIYKIEEVKEIALRFSADNNIVNEKINGKKTWANLRDEDGLDGGGNDSYEARKRQSDLMKDNAVVKDGIGGHIRVSKEEFDKGYYEGINKGKKLTEEHKKQINPKGRTHTTETKSKMSKAQKGKVTSEETKAKISKARLGTKASEATLIALKNQPKITCPHCGLKGSIGNMNRWHNDNCKYK